MYNGASSQLSNTIFFFAEKVLNSKTIRSNSSGLSVGSGKYFFLQLLICVVINFLCLNRIRISLHLYMQFYIVCVCITVCVDI